MIDLNKIKNITNIANITIPSVLIWESNKLCSKLLKITKTPVILYSSLLSKNFVCKSLSIVFIKSFLLNSGLESLILMEILASSSFTDI